MSAVEQTVHFKHPIQTASYDVGSQDFVLAAWELSATIDPPMHLDDLSVQVGGALPAGSVDPLRGYSTNYSTEDVREDDDTADGVSIRYVRLVAVDESVHDEVVENLKDVAVALGAALGATTVTYEWE